MAREKTNKPLAAELLQKAHAWNEVTAATSLQRTADDLKGKWFHFKLFSKKRAAAS